MKASTIKSGTMSSEYMAWAKTSAQANFNLAASGVESYPLGELPVKIEDLQINGPGGYGYAPLQQALAAKSAVDSDCVVAAIGTSFANFLAMAATIEAGDEVLIEQPVYGPLLDVARYLGAEIRRFPRPFVDGADGFQIDIREIERTITPSTRLIVITNLHNPSSAFVDEETLKRIGEIARGIGARVLVDEVYLETLFERAPRSAFHLGREFVTTTSLTKAYGLSGLRCGWILAEPDLARKLWGLVDITIGIPAHPAELLSCVALANLEKIARRAKGLLDANRAVVNRFLEERDELETGRSEYGTVVFPRLKSGRVEELCALLREKYDTTLVPGRFFEMPDHFRLGFVGDPEMVVEGISRLGKALDEL
jgi:aspartate/methionine/tyrosine aminotransferase